MTQSASTRFERTRARPSEAREGQCRSTVTRQGRTGKAARDGEAVKAVPPKRKLAAILSADAVGYSRLMAADEVATLRTLEAHRNAMAALIRQHDGRVVDAVGDNLLAEFGSVV